MQGCLDLALDGELFGKRPIVELVAPLLENELEMATSLALWMTRYTENTDFATVTSPNRYLNRMVTVTVPTRVRCSGTVWYGYGHGDGTRYATPRSPSR